MAALSLMGFSLPEGLILSKAVNTSNMAASNVLTNNATKQEAVNLSKTFSKITVQNVLSENNGNTINISNNNNNGNSGGTITSSNAIVRQIKDFGMVGAVNNAVGNGNNASNLTTSATVASKSVTVTQRKRPLGESKNNKNISSETNKPTSGTPVTKKARITKESKTPTPKTAKKSLNNENVQRPKSKSASVLNPLNTNLAGNLNPRPAGTPGRKGLPLPQAVARRNARERNRVKQVNNGFAALRERIPEEVAEAFESQSTSGSGSGRGGSGCAAAKKLSKVETLRMAVEYIRSLERLLGFDFSTMNGGQHGSSGGGGGGSSGEDSYTLIKDEFDTLSPSIDEHEFDDSLSHYDMDDYFSTTSNMKSNDFTQAELLTPPPMDLLPDITTLNGLQYIRIPGTNTYQLLTPDIFVGNTHSPPNSSLDDEQFNALIDSNCMSPTLATTTSSAVNLTTSPINNATNNSASPTTTATTTRSFATPASPLNIVTMPPYSGAGECINTPTALSKRLSMLPTQMQLRTTSTSSSATSSSSTTTSSSPDAGSSSSIYQQQQPQHQQATVTLSPANAIINERTLQTCATTTTSTATIQGIQQQRQFIAPTLPHLLPQFIKQEYVGDQVDFALITTTTTSSPIYQTTTTAAGDQHATHSSLSSSSLSPPLDRCNRLLIAPHHTSHTNAIELQSFYEQDDSGSFYESNLSFKKDLNDVLLDASTATNGGLSDESMIEAIDWWEAHTPQSEGGGGGGAGGCGSVML